VDDKGVPLGIEPDGFENEDKYLLHVNNRLQQHIGAEHAANVRFGLYPSGSRKALLIECSPASKPVFLIDAGQESFYVRAGPGTRKLTMSQMLSYDRRTRQNLEGYCQGSHRRSANQGSYPLIVAGRKAISNHDFFWKLARMDRGRARDWLRGGLPVLGFANCMRSSLFSISCCLLLSISTGLSDDWPQWMGPGRDDVWREPGILQTFPASGPAVLWHSPIEGGYSGPAVAGNRLFVLDRPATSTTNSTELKPGQTVAPRSERVLCLDAATGTKVWEHTYPRGYEIGYPGGPRTTPAVAEGRVYTLGAMGDLLCLRADNGQVVGLATFRVNIMRNRRSGVGLLIPCLTVIG
jgi:hypothetical protein